MNGSISSSRFNEELLREFLARQYGLVTTAQVDPDALSYRARAGELQRILPRVYRSTLFAPSMRQIALAAVLWAGDDAVASHTTAARLYGAEIGDARPHVWVPRSRNPKSALVFVHRGDVPRIDRRVRDRVPLTSPARTLIDCAGRVDEETLHAAVEDFLLRGITTAMAIQRCLDATGGTGRAGSHILRALLADRDQAPLEKRLEVKLWRLLRTDGLRPVRQYEATIGRNKYRLDFAFPGLKVAVEGHGFAAHGGRVAHVGDNQRLANLVGAGWRVVPVTWEAITGDPASVLANVRSALVEAAA